LIAINFLHKGDAIGYGGKWTCPEDMLVGVVAIGYGDGYPRHAKNGTPLLIRDVRCPLIGRVSMDMISVDLRNCQDASINDSVTLWGRGLPAEEVAVWVDTIPYTLFCGVTNRVKYVEV
jgi:alanine racemase